MMLLHHAVSLATTPGVCPKVGSGGILGPIAKPIAAVLAAFYSVVPNYGVAILALSVVWMIIIAPLTLKSTRSMLAMQKLQPQLKKLQEQHKNDRQAFAQAQMDLFREHNVSPFGSCLPMLLPLPVFFALFRLIDGLSHMTNGVSCPQYLSHNTQMFHAITAAHGHINAFGIDLAKNALSPHSSFGVAIPFYILLLIMIGTQYAQTAQMMSRNPAAANNPQAKMMKFLPLIFGVICIRFPAGVVLYYAMSNLCRIAQQTLMYRFDPKVRTLVAQEVIEVEAHTTELERGKGGKGGKGGGSPGGSKPAGAPPPRPRSRFQQLLANAQEQQSERNAAKARARDEAGAANEPAGGPGQRAGGGGAGGRGNGAGPGGGRGGGRGGGGRGGGSRGGGRSADRRGGQPAPSPASTKAGGDRPRGANGGGDRAGGSDRSDRSRGSGGAGGQGNGSGGDSRRGNPPPTRPKASNGNRNSSGRPGAGGRTGARSGNRKRRGR